MIPVPLSSPDITAVERSAVLEVLSGSSLSLGPKLPEFESAVCRVTGTRFAVAVNSGTSALHLCVKAAEIGEGDEVVTTPFSFVASANCVLYERATPVFADIDPITYNLDPREAARAITSRTKAILPVHVFGRPCDMRSLLHLAEQRDLHVIEDACEAIGASVAGRPAGSLGDTGVFAFYPNKQITTGEGGMIATNDERTAELCRSWRNQGRSDHGGWLQHERLGYNYRLSDINCALGIVQIQRLPEILRNRARVAALYHTYLDDCGEVILPAMGDANGTVSWFVFVVRLADEFSQADRDRILDSLSEQGIGCSNYFSPIHLQPFYRRQFGFARGDFPFAEHVSERTIALPFHARMEKDQVRYVCRALREALARTCRPKVAAAGSMFVSSGDGEVRP
jgi:perosamine synthetase